MNTSIMKCNKPEHKPHNPHFSSGPCSKRPGWSPDVLKNAVLGRSHRSALGKNRLLQVIEQTKELLPIPDGYHVGIVPASDTGAVEMALWSLLGEKTVDVYAWENFSHTWLKEVATQLNLTHNRYVAEYGKLPRLSHYNPDNDSVFVFNGTTSGVRLPDLSWVSDNRSGLTICDATSAVFSQDIDFSKLDVTTWSWQKALGSEGAHGMIVLSPRAVERLENYTPPWPMPKIFTLTRNGKLNHEIFEGATINTPSMLCVEDVLDAMQWVRSIGGVTKTQALSNESLATVSAWVDKTPWVEFLAQEPTQRSNTAICLSICDERFVSLSEDEQWDFVKRMCQQLEDEEVAYDIKAYKTAPPGLRIWTGATVTPNDVALLLPWLDWAFTTEIQRLS